MEMQRVPRGLYYRDGDSRRGRRGSCRFLSIFFCFFSLCHPGSLLSDTAGESGGQNFDHPTRSHEPYKYHNPRYDARQNSQYDRFMLINRYVTRLEECKRAFLKNSSPRLDRRLSELRVDWMMVLKLRKMISDIASHLPANKKHPPKLARLYMIYDYYLCKIVFDQRLRRMVSIYNETSDKIGSIFDSLQEEAKSISMKISLDDIKRSADQTLYNNSENLFTQLYEVKNIVGEADQAFEGRVHSRLPGGTDQLRIVRNYPATLAFKNSAPPQSQR